MPLVVLDSSVVIKWFLAESDSDRAHRILDQIEGRTLEVVIPDLLYAEVGNVLWKRYLFHGHDRDECASFLRDLQAVLLPIVPVTLLFERAFALAADHRRTVYDMLYLALAEREDCPLITADERLVNAVSAAFPRVALLSRYV